MSELVSKRRQHTKQELMFLVFCGCVFSTVSVSLLNKFTLVGFISGSIFQGIAIGCCLVAYRATRVGQRLVPSIGLTFVFIILALELIFAIVQLL